MLGQDASDLGALVALDLDPAILDGATGAAGFLHLFGELLFLGQADADEIADDGHGFAAAPGGLAEDVDPTPVLFGGGTIIARHRHQSISEMFLRFDF